jgi:hypothetical protein
MSEKRLSSLEKIGYVKTLPESADINDYESITIKGENGTKVTLYRNLEEREEIDDTTNFSSSWDVFNTHLSS